MGRLTLMQNPHLTIISAQAKTSPTLKLSRRRGRRRDTRLETTLHITRAQWLGLASDNHSLRHIYSLCLLANGAEIFSYRERRLASKLLQKLEIVVHLPMAGHELTKTIVSDFLDLETQVTKRLERLHPSHRRQDASS